MDEVLYRARVHESIDSAQAIAGIASERWSVGAIGCAARPLRPTHRVWPQGRFGAVPTASQTRMIYCLNVSCWIVSRGPFMSTETLRRARGTRSNINMSVRLRELT